MVIYRGFIGDLYGIYMGITLWIPLVICYIAIDGPLK